MNHKIYAFDFDGVICDSAVETGTAGWLVARKLWSDMPETMPPALMPQFRTVRPVMETGYEATLIMRLLFEGMPADMLMEAFHHQIEALLIRDALNVDELKEVFGATRDEWIAEDFSSWIAMNPLFDGIADKLKQIDTDNSFIITTKQERFVDHILSANAIQFPLDRIYGLDRNLSKQQILTDLSLEHPEAEILFIEDRLPTLINVITDDRLDRVKLFLADWGYNTAEDRDSAASIKRIRIISLADMPSL
ncbi:HAD family hydrolase [Methylophaga sp.]|jgi:phosphoglycolate phosphatase-like HAD superfamily hydrolase|uniref:HAD family hydrolase n=1 Tax=Methylophaga sp. TaxID=2024840 RepID=UPI001401375B|nr:HAD family hydrolase [Methylophaga sp.]MTI62963.1 HAD family hydrolase [Methylophaga sp.]